MVNKRVWNAVLGCNLKNDRMISVHFQGKPFDITVIQVYAPMSNTEETEVEWFYEDLQDPSTLATSCKELTHWKRLWCWEGLGAGREGDDQGWDGWMTSVLWAWVNSGKWWWTGRPGVLWFMGSQRVRHDWVTELNWQDLLELTPKKDVLFIKGNWNAKVGIKKHLEYLALEYRMKQGKG